jgi:hypothetical protein
VVFGCKLHLTCITGELVVSLTADVTTTTNVPGNKMYFPLTSPSPSLTFSLLTLRYMVADPGYDDKKLYEYSKSIENRSGLSGRAI